MNYIITALYLPLFVLGFCIGVIARPIVAGINEGYFYVEISERIKVSQEYKKTSKKYESNNGSNNG